MAWTTLHLQVVTPLFSGDEPKGVPTIRVPSVRGALRYWLRAVTAGRGLVGQADLQALWEAEERVLGSTRKPSPIALRIRSQPAAATDRRPDWTRNSTGRTFDGAHYLLGQGLWSYRDGLTRDHVPSGAKFDLDVRFSGDDVVDGRFMVSLWAWLTYGGLGARTRRGFGQLRCVGVDGAPLPVGWTAGTLAQPRQWGSWERLATAVYPPAAPWSDAERWSDLPIRDVDLATVAEPPALDRRWWAGSIVEVGVETLGEALHQIGLDWRRFRAGPDAEMDENDLPFAGTRSPEWTDVIHGTGSTYPVGALGLPVNYYSTSKQPPFSAAVTPMLGTGELRRASPIWLRPVRLSDGQWQMFTFYFASRLLPEGTSLHLTSGRRRLKNLTPPPQADADRTWTRWLNLDDRLAPGTDLSAP